MWFQTASEGVTRLCFRPSVPSDSCKHGAGGGGILGGSDKQFLGRVTLWVGILSHLRVLRAAGVKGIGKIQKYQVLGLALPPVPSVPGTEGH